MQSSSKVIKRTNVNAYGEEEIRSEFKVKKVSNERIYNKKVNKISPKVLDKSSVENVANGIIQEARKKSSKIISEAYDKAYIVKEEAVQEGFKKGYDDGYKDGYDKSIDDATKEAEKIKNEAKSILMNAKDEHQKYVYRKKEDIKNLIVNIVDKVLNKEIENIDCFSNMINDYLDECKKSKTIIVKCNSQYKENLNKQIEQWKKSCGYRGEIFVIEDIAMEKGKIEIEKDNGRMYVDINECMEKIEDIIKNS